MIELIAVVLTLLSVWLISKRNIWCWPVGIIASLSYMWFFKTTSSIANMWLQLVYVSQSIYGWYFWKKKENEKFLISITPKRFIIDLSIVFLISMFLSFYLSKNTNDMQPTYDAITTLLSLLGTWYLSRKNAWGWVTFLMADVFFVSMFLSQDKYLSAFLYTFLMGMCVYGLFEWSKTTIKK